MRLICEGLLVLFVLCIELTQAAVCDLWIDFYSISLSIHKQFKELSKSLMIQIERSRDKTFSQCSTNISEVVCEENYICRQEICLGDNLHNNSSK